MRTTYSNGESPLLGHQILSSELSCSVCLCREFGFIFSTSFLHGLFEKQKRMERNRRIEN